MKKIQLISILLVSALCVNAKEIVLKPGQLPGEMSSIIAEGESSLVLKGTATPFDLTALRSLPNSVTSLDMSQLTIKGSDAVNGDWFGKRHYEDGEIPAYMLLSTNVSTLALPAYVSSIGAGAFSGTPLTEISVSGVKNVEEGAFHDCKKLRKAEFSDATFKTVPDRLFSGCVSLEEVQLPHVVTSVGSRAFEKCNVKSVFIPNVFSIGDYAFAYASSLTEISFANGCRMGEGAFYATGSLESVAARAANFPALYSASGSYDDTITLHGEEIGEGAFSGARLSAMAIGEDVRRIGAYAFHAMPNLSKIDVASCSSIPDADPLSFAGNDLSAITLYVNKGETEKWKAAPVWGLFRISEDESGINETGVNAVSENPIRIEKIGDRISVSSLSPIMEVGIYSLDGRQLFSSVPGSDSFEMNFPSEEDIVVVRVAGSGSVKIAKLMK